MSIKNPKKNSLLKKMISIKKSFHLLSLHNFKPTIDIIKNDYLCAQLPTLIPVLSNWLIILGYHSKTKFLLKPFGYHSKNTHLLNFLTVMVCLSINKHIFFINISGSTANRYEEMLKTDLSLRKKKKYI